MTITATHDQVRLLIGDTDSTAPLFQDDEIRYFLGERGDNVYQAAADACDSAATRYARAYDFETDSQRFMRSQASKAYAAMAKQYRARAQGISSLVPTKVDGFSVNIPADQVQTTNANPRRAFYGELDFDAVP